MTSANDPSSERGAAPGSAHEAELDEANSRALTLESSLYHSELEITRLISERDEARSECGLWKEAALKKIRTWDSLQSMHRAGDSAEMLASEFGVPVRWITFVMFPENDLDARYGRPSDRTHTAKADRDAALIELRAVKAERDEARLQVHRFRSATLTDVTEDTDEAIEQAAHDWQSWMEAMNAIRTVERWPPRSFPSMNERWLFEAQHRCIVDLRAQLTASEQGKADGSATERLSCLTLTAERDEARKERDHQGLRRDQAVAEVMRLSRVVTDAESTVSRLTAQLQEAQQVADRWRAIAREQKHLTDATESSLTALASQLAGLRDSVATLAVLRETLSDLGLTAGANIATVQRRLRVGAADAMRLLAIREAANSIAAALHDAQTTTPEPISTAESSLTALREALQAVRSTSRGVPCWCDASYHDDEHVHQKKCRDAATALSLTPRPPLTKEEPPIPDRRPDLGPR